MSSRWHCDSAGGNGCPSPVFAMAFQTRWGESDACGISPLEMDARLPGRCRISTRFKINLRKSCQVNGLNRFKAPSINASATSNPRKAGRNSSPASAKSFPQRHPQPPPQRPPLQSDPSSPRSSADLVRRDVLIAPTGGLRNSRPLPVGCACRAMPFNDSRPDVTDEALHVTLL